MASIIKVDALQEKTSGNGIVLENSLKSSSGTEIMSAAGALSGNVTFPAGHVIQMVNTTSKLPSSHTSAAYTNTNLAVSITPKAIGSKLLISFSFNYGATGSGANDVRLNKTISGVTTTQLVTPSTDDVNPLSNLYAVSTAIQMKMFYGTTLEDTTTSLSQIDFVLTAKCSSSYTLYIGNRNDNNVDCRAAHHITVYEIAQ